MDKIPTWDEYMAISKAMISKGGEWDADPTKDLEASGSPFVGDKAIAVKKLKDGYNAVQNGADPDEGDVKSGDLSNYAKEMRGRRDELEDARFNNFWDDAYQRSPEGAAGAGREAANLDLNLANNAGLMNLSPELIQRFRARAAEAAPFEPRTLDPQV